MTFNELSNLLSTATRRNQLVMQVRLRCDEAGELAHDMCECRRRECGAGRFVEMLGRGYETAEGFLILACPQKERFLICTLSVKDDAA